MIYPAFAEVSLKGGVALYIGSISQPRNQQFFSLVGERKLERLVITSDGGEVSAGIALGLWVHESGVDVEVRDYCLSSCANYVFTAGQNKIITPGAVVAWHGNYHHLKHTDGWKDDVPQRMQSTGEDEIAATRYVYDQVDRLVRQEQAFFNKIGVDEFLCWVGKTSPFHVPNYYFLSKKDMAKFGVRRVVTPDNYERTDVSELAEHIMYLSLQE